ncbi:hypothetical protein [Mangrovihabitans endophyticus]|nr:hypothetical protein [Mangrovihabitans endophyticus]
MRDNKARTAEQRRAAPQSGARGAGTSAVVDRWVRRMPRAVQADRPFEGGWAGATAVVGAGPG